jgi:hypothetical protein
MNACSSSSVAAASRSTVNARPIAAATPVSSAAGRDRRASRPAITACTFGAAAGASGCSASTTKNGLPSLSS